MAQASLLDGLTLDLFALTQDVLGPAMICIGWRNVAEALMIAAVVIVLDEGSDLALKISRQLIVFEQYSVFQRLVPALDLALGLRTTRRTTDVLDISSPQPFGQITSDVTRPVIGQQARLVSDFSPGAA